jgi:hypothetical protein
MPARSFSSSSDAPLERRRPRVGSIHISAGSATREPTDGPKHGRARRFSPKIDRSYPKPKLKLLLGACDTHFNFIRPQKQFALKSNDGFSYLEFEHTTTEDWLKMQRRPAFPRGLHVQSMMYENNYEIALHG